MYTQDIYWNKSGKLCYDGDWCNKTADEIPKHFFELSRGKELGTSGVEAEGAGEGGVAILATQQAKPATQAHDKGGCTTPLGGDSDSFELSSDEEFAPEKSHKKVH